MNDTTSSQKMLLISHIIFVLIFIYFAVPNGSDDDLFKWFIRVIVSLAVAMSMSLSGSINIGKKEGMKTLAETSPNITAAASFAVFVIVYLFNPIGSAL
jgi:uncharacterized membrane protein YozB (DUF420 family)